MTSARHVNPRTPREVLQAFDKTSRRSFGYLLADYKQKTKEKDSLRANFLDVELATKNLRPNDI